MTGAEAPPVEHRGWYKNQKLIRLLALLLIAVAVTFFLWWHFEHGKIHPAAPASAATVENRASTSINGFLKSGDTEAYQSSQTSLALQYLDANDTANAERIMNKVFQKVPHDKLLENSYYTMIQVQQKKNDKQQTKHYLLLLIAKLRADGKPSAADQEQKVLDAL